MRRLLTAKARVRRLSS